MTCKRTKGQQPIEEKVFSMLRKGWMTADDVDGLIGYRHTSQRVWEWIAAGILILKRRHGSRVAYRIVRAK